MSGRKSRDGMGQEENGSIGEQIKEATSSMVVGKRGVK